MVARIEQMLNDMRAGKHYVYRKQEEYAPVSEFVRKKVPAAVRVAKRTQEVLRKEKPVILPGQKIVFLRTVKNLPEIFSEDEWKEVCRGHYIHEQGRVCNISPDYERVIKYGLEAERKKCLEKLDGANEAEKEFLSSVAMSVEAVYEITERYKKEALKQNREDVARVLDRVPREGAASFREALQSLRILQYVLWCEGEYHNTLGRFDQYMYPYLEKDLKDGTLDDEEAFELLEEFFLSLNLDSDLYPGIQQGDNGQSMMLGGVDRNGKEVFNRLSSMCLAASRELQVIDPKINLRVNKDTPIEIYEEGTELTKAGLGFPQYSNDDVVIKGLIKKGYSEEDARDYTVAACWEYIIPKVGMDIPNIGAVNFPKLFNDALREDLEGSEDYGSFYQKFAARLESECKAMLEERKNLYMVPAPFMSLMMDGCIERKQDISFGNKYNNFGFHGVGIATVVDALAVVKKCIYEEKSLSKEDALMVTDPEQHSAQKEQILQRLRYEEPKFGDGDAVTDEIAVRLFDDFGRATVSLRNERGGCVRAGTGSAMFYLWHAAGLSDMLSGHREGEAFSANYAPELFVRSKGPLSAIMSLTKPDLTNVINGGPMTMEFHSTVFRSEDGVKKVAKLVEQFVKHGGHQLQLNSVNKETMLAAQKNPEQYKNLIVRIWGWSAYFVELDREYQDHVIARQEYRI